MRKKKYDCSAYIKTSTISSQQFRNSMMEYNPPNNQNLFQQPACSKLQQASISKYNQNSLNCTIAGKPINCSWRLLKTPQLSSEYNKNSNQSITPSTSHSLMRLTMQSSLKLKNIRKLNQARLRLRTQHSKQHYQYQCHQNIRSHRTGQQQKQHGLWEYQDSVVNLVKIGELYRQGAFGRVYRGLVTNGTTMEVMVKKIQVDPNHVSRQQYFAKILRNPYIVQFLGTYHTKQTRIQKQKKDEQPIRSILHPDSQQKQYITQEKQGTVLNIIMQKYGNNLNEILQAESLNSVRIKIYAYQMLRALMYLHSLNICHRDIKPHNFVIKNQNNSIYLCDFGAAKVMQPSKQAVVDQENFSQGWYSKMNVIKRQPGSKLSTVNKNITHNFKIRQRSKPKDDKIKSVAYIFSREYRAPQLLFGYQEYDKSVDIWALGCVFAEMVLKKPLFNGNNNLDQIIKVLKVFGSPRWETVSFCKQRVPKIPQIKGIGLAQVMQDKCDRQFIKLLQKMLQVEPNRRITAIQALCDPYFDQIREQSFYRAHLRSTGMPNLFYFTKRQYFGREELVQKLVPYWMKQHCKRFEIDIQDYKF